VADTSIENTTASAEAVSYNSEIAQIADFWTLMKPGVMYLVVFTGFAGLMVAPGTIHPLLGAVAILCIAIASGGAGAINMWYDRDIDAIMTRTKRRPIPAGRMAPDVALSFGVILSIFSAMLMGLAVNWTAGLLLALANGFYVFVYTMFLKRRTPQNIVIGGAAGAFPPMIGWAAVTGTVSIESIVLFLVIFMWTPPHFWALALYKDGDYAAAKVPMLPVVAGRKNTKWQMLVYTLALFPIVLAPVYFNIAGMFYGAVALIASLYFLYLNIRVLCSDEDRHARKMFLFSILYLFVLFAVLIIDRSPGIMSLIAG
jgi:protoheme IX farnesyltransferase